MSAPHLRLITRGDDAGSCSAANRAVLETCEQGIVRNASLMVPGLAFAETAQLFARRPEICLGLHVTLNAEWQAVRWGPVLPPERVPSLVDERGHFLPSPRHLRDRGFVLEEAVAEAQAQLARARALGVEIAYLDEHMGVGWLPGLRERLAELAEREGLVDAHSFRSLPAIESAAEDLVSMWLAWIDGASAGTYVLVTHPGIDEEMRQFGDEPGVVARERDAERRALTDARLAKALQERGVEIVRYTDAA
jgi:chitin disaccharide deacetylase